MESSITAWNVTKYGAPEVLAPVTREMPLPGKGQVLIRVRASGVTRADCMMRAGEPKFARPFLGWSRPRAGLAGTCFAGDIVALGDGVTQFSVGDAVFGEAGLKFGANASHICLAADATLHAKPESLSYEKAATLCDGALTSWYFLTQLAKVKAGERVLILGGAGSLGSAAVQFAVALGAEVSATSSAGNSELLSGLGVAQPIDYRASDPLAVRDRYHVVFDTLGLASFSAARRALKDGGRYLSPVLGLGLLRDMLSSRLAGRKRAYFAAAGLEKPSLHRKLLAEILALIEAGRFTPVMDRQLPLSELVAAHRYVETGHKRGNVVVV